jgi:CRP-like cAMP-binding protein
MEVLYHHGDGKIELLAKLPLFSGLGSRDLKLIASHVDQLKVDAGTLLIRQGQLAREFVAIVEGSAQVKRDDTVIARLGPGDFFGELPLIEGTPQTATVIAETPAVLVVAEARSFSYLLTAVPEVQRRLLLWGSASASAKLTPPGLGRSARPAVRQRRQ